MKHLVKKYLDNHVSRRDFIAGLTALGLTATAARSMAQSLSPIAPGGRDGESPERVREMTGQGGALFVQQLKAAGTEFIFFNPATSDAAVFDALAEEPSIQLIKGVHEGAVVAMADGYARLSGKPGIVIVANVGLPNAMTQMVNTYKDRIPMLVMVASFAQDAQGRDGPQEYDFQESMLAPITKWRWEAPTARSIPEITRRSLKFATTPPAGAVFMAVPADVLRAQATASILDQQLFDVAMRVRPDQAAVERAARLLIEAKNPLLSVGDEITLCRGEQEVVELAELLGLPVAGQGELGVWSMPFPNRHPLFLGPRLRTMRFPGEVDVYLNIGSRHGEMSSRGGRVISIRQDPDSLARTEPVDVPMVADVRLATLDLIAAVKSMATPARLKEIAATRSARTHEYTKQAAELRQQMVAAIGNGPAIRRERLAVELEAGLEKDSIYMTDLDSGRAMDSLMSFGGAGKTYVATGPNILGWAAAAGFGAKLARPDRPVVSIMGDGAMMFGGPQPLWSMARYQAPVLNLVYNNRSYNNERNRIWSLNDSVQFRIGRDMTCYNGSPDVDFAKDAEAYGVEAETVREVAAIRPALDRAKRVIAEGRPYLLDIQVERDGVGASSTWHPEYSLAARRTRQV